MQSLAESTSLGFSLCLGHRGQEHQKTAGKQDRKDARAGYNPAAPPIPRPLLSKQTHHKLLLLLHGWAVRRCQLRAGWFAWGGTQWAGALQESGSKVAAAVITPGKEERQHPRSPGGRWLQGQQEAVGSLKSWAPGQEGAGESSVPPLHLAQDSKMGEGKQKDPPASLDQ